MICVKLTNSNGFLTREVMGERKSCSEYIFLKKIPKRLLHCHPQKVCNTCSSDYNIATVKPTK